VAGGRLTARGGHAIIARTMASRLRELVGRAMTDPDFVTELQQMPETVLARYELTDDERKAILSAVVRLTGTPPWQREQALRAALLRRLAT
jgi:hypothetical protein